MVLVYCNRNTKLPSRREKIKQGTTKLEPLNGSSPYESMRCGIKMFRFSNTRLNSIRLCYFTHLEKLWVRQQTTSSQSVQQTLIIARQQYYRRYGRWAQYIKRCYVCSYSQSLLWISIYLLCRLFPVGMIIIVITPQDYKLNAAHVHKSFRFRVVENIFIERTV